VAASKAAGSSLVRNHLVRLRTKVLKLELEKLLEQGKRPVLMLPRPSQRH